MNWIIGSLAGIFTALGLLHLYWLFRGGKGLAGVVPEVEGRPAFRPGPVATLAVAAALLAAAGIVLWRGGWIEPAGPAFIPRAGTWTLAGVFLARAVGDFRLVGFFKKTRGSQFARLDDRIYSPLCLLLFLGAFVLAAFG